jgi:parvulin-like peptidyl-prolyl isomerase
VLGEAPRLEVTVDDKQVDRYINQILSTTQMTSVDELRKAVEESGQYGSWAEYLDVLREQMLAFQVRSILAPVNVTEAQVRARYRELAAGEEAEADVVRMDFRPVDDRAKSRDEAYAAAKKVARRLSSGEAVDKVAGEYGLPSAVETLKRGQIAQVFREPVFTARTGAVVGPLEAGQGYTVFKIVEMRASDLRGYEEAKDELRETLSFEAEAKAFAALDEDLRARAHVEIRL